MSIRICIIIALILAALSAQAQTSWGMMTLAGDTLQARPSPEVIYVLAGNYSCASCYREVEKAIRGLDTSLRIACIIRPSENTAVSRRNSLTRMAKLIRADTVFFDTGDVSSDRLGKYATGIFGAHSIHITPCVLLYTPNHAWRLITYTELYGDEDAKDRIASIRAVLRRARQDE